MEIYLVSTLIGTLIGLTTTILWKYSIKELIEIILNKLKFFPELFYVCLILIYPTIIASISLSTSSVDYLSVFLGFLIGFVILKYMYYYSLGEITNYIINSVRREYRSDITLNIFNGIIMFLGINITLFLIFYDKK